MTAAAAAAAAGFGDCKLVPELRERNQELCRFVADQKLLEETKKKNIKTFSGSVLYLPNHAVIICNEQTRGGLRSPEVIASRLQDDR